MILRDVFAKTVADLKAHNIEGAARDARALLTHAIDLPADRLTMEGDKVLTKEDLWRVSESVSRRCQGEPVARIIGQRLFWGRYFTITPDVLDPRGDTEILIEQALHKPADMILDLGTGSGCIGLTLLCEWSKAQLVATDISPPALSVAQENAERLGVTSRVTFLHADWASHPDLHQYKGGFDLIVSNPPYIADHELATLERDVRAFDPLIALSPGQNALAAYEIIAAQAKDFLVPKGRLIVEIGHRLGDAVQNIFSSHGYDEISVLKDFDQNDRVVACHKPPS